MRYRRRSTSLTNIPVKVADGTTIFVKDLGYVRDGSLAQQNVVQSDGRRWVLLSVIKNANGSTVDVARELKKGLTLCEAYYPAVHYIPRKDVDTTLLARTDLLPYKGDAAYFSTPTGGDRSIDAVWTYETPYAAVAGIKDHLAFYPDRVDAIEIQF
jgi:uncharacterized protein (DUF427 family)